MHRDQYHIPVLDAAVVRWASGSLRIADGTAGGGGHLARLLGPGVRALAIDRDPSAIAAVRERFGDAVVRYLCASFGSPEALAAMRDFRPDFVLLDLGVSSSQLDQVDRGFSFRPGAPLDMRMSGAGRTAAEYLNSAAPADLRRVFQEYGDERRAGRLAGEIVRRRTQQRFRSSDDLVNAIRGALGPRTGPPDFARLFQAVRIEINGELDTLRTALEALREIVVPGGRIVVISYHSGEDRIVKDTFRAWGQRCICPPRHPICTCRGRPLGRVLTRKPETPGREEIAGNPRARSAKLRVFETADGT